MTRLLLCTATILVLTVSANAAELPDEMVNEDWRQCLVNEHGDTVPDDEEGRNVYAPNNAQECPEVGGGFFLWKTGYSGEGMGNCEFDKIEKTSTNAYRVHANCELHWSLGNNKHGIDFRTENLELEIIDGHLVVTYLSEGPELIHSRMPVPLPRSRPVWDNSITAQAHERDIDCVVTDPTKTPLNLRRTPNGTILGALHNDTTVFIREIVFVNGKRRARIVSETGRRNGWVFFDHLDCSRLGH